MGDSFHHQKMARTKRPHSAGGVQPPSPNARKKPHRVSVLSSPEKNAGQSIQSCDSLASASTSTTQQGITSDLPIDSPFLTDNPFQVLQNLNDNTEATVIQRVPKPPPIFIKQLNNFPLMCKQLDERLGKEAYICINRRENTKIMPTSADSYRGIIKYLTETKASFYTYQLKEERSLRVVIRNLHHTTPKETIKEELTEMGFKVTNVSNVISLRDNNETKRVPLPLFFVDIEISPFAPQIYQITKLCHTKVKVEKPNPRKEIVQCHHCQEYGHTKTYCHQIPRCVKCGGTHKSQECRKSPDVPAVCALCTQNHPANYKGCEVYQQIKRRTQPANSSTARNVRPPPRDVIPGTSYAQMARTTMSKHPEFPTLEKQPQQQAISHIPPPPATNDLQTILTSFFNEFKSLITPLITLLTTVVSKLIPTPSP